MKKLNLFGQELLNYKTELLKTTYPKVVHDSLVLAVTKLETDKFISNEIKEYLIDREISLCDFEKEILNIKNCKKTKEELLEEFDKIKDSFLSEVYEEESLKPVDVSFESNIEEDKIIIKKEFLITDEFLKSYFYIPTDEDFEVLMKRKGFIEKFAILRLEKIMKDFLISLENKSGFNFAISSVFFQGTTKCYGILFLIEIDIQDFYTSTEELNITNMQEYAHIVLDVLDKVTTYFNIKLYS